jgi:hypothetical protein
MKSILFLIIYFINLSITLQKTNEKWSDTHIIIKKNKIWLGEINSVGKYIELRLTENSLEITVSQNIKFAWGMEEICEYFTEVTKKGFEKLRKNKHFRINIDYGDIQYCGSKHFFKNGNEICFTFVIKNVEEDKDPIYKISLEPETDAAVINKLGLKKKHLDNFMSNFTQMVNKERFVYKDVGIAEPIELIQRQLNQPV